MTELHFKVAHEILRNYNVVYIGLFRNDSIKNNPKNERLVTVLNPNKFRQILRSLAKKNNAQIVEIDEYLTTKICSNCGKINDIGRNKIYRCNCNIILDRDINAAKNILKIGSTVN